MFVLKILRFIKKYYWIVSSGGMFISSSRFPLHNLQFYRHYPSSTYFLQDEWEQLSLHPVREVGKTATPKGKKSL